ncbi:MAG: TIGR03943 family protein [Lacrimispora sp.]|uniref:TIGR03943 family putative permease subunit n=1 Tax=Lacrimispora sp. TaxID=2719234 RepID=UPI0039E2F1D2
MRARAFNPQIFLELLCYCLFGGSMLYLVNSGKYLSYVTPRMKPYLYFTAAVMLIWVCVSLFKLFRPQHIVRSSHCFVLAIPVLLLLLPHGSLNTSDFSSNYIGGNTFSGKNGVAGVPAEEYGKSSADPAGGQSDAAQADIEVPGSIDSTVPETQPDAAGQGSLAYLPGLDTANRKITVSDDSFGMWLSEIYMNMKKYEGYTITMTGFVFKDPELLNEDEFVPARLIMSCCVADLAPAGMICKYDKVSELENDSWVTVEGTIFIAEYEYEGQKYSDPQIRAEKITPAQEVEGYVYSY